MFKLKSIVQGCVLLSVLLLPLAQIKAVLLGIPLYSVEIPVLMAFVAYMYDSWQGEFSPLKRVGFCDPLFWGIALFFFGAVLSLSLNPFSLTGLGMIKTWFVFPLLLIWLWFGTSPEKRDAEQILFVWLGVVTVVSLIVLGYFFQGILTYDGRLAGWYGSPNYLAFFVAPGIFLAHYFYFHPLFPKMKIFKPAVLLALILFIGVLFSTHSYATWISIALAGLVFLFLDTTAIASWRKKLVAALLLVMVVGVFLFFEAGSEKWHTLVAFQDRSSLASREMIWQVAIKSISDHPLFGIGMGRFQEVYLSYQNQFPLYLEWAVPQPHNLYMAVWLQTGLLGLLGFCLLVLIWLRQLLVLLNSPSGEEKKYIGALCIALLSLYLFLGLVDTPFFKTDLAFIFWLIIGIGISVFRKRDEE